MTHHVLAHQVGQNDAFHLLPVAREGHRIRLAERFDLELRDAVELSHILANLVRAIDLDIIHHLDQTAREAGL